MSPSSSLVAPDDPSERSPDVAGADGKDGGDARAFADLFFFFDVAGVAAPSPPQCDTWRRRSSHRRGASRRNLARGLRAPPPAERFYVARPPPEVAASIGRGAQGSLSSGEVKGLPTVPSERQCDVYYDDDDEQFVRVAPIEAGSRLQECAAHVAQIAC